MAESEVAPNYCAPDGYRYGVMFHDGSVADWWNGRTQRERAEEHARRWLEQARESAKGRAFIDTYTVVRHRPGQPWTSVTAPARTNE